MSQDSSEIGLLSFVLRQTEPCSGTFTLDCHIHKKPLRLLRAHALDPFQEEDGLADGFGATLS